GIGEETRDFTFVDDVVEGILRAGVIVEAVGEAINLASESETKIIDLANLINRLLGSSNGIKFVKRRNWDRIIRRRASIGKAKKVLGYNPKTDIKTGVQKTIDWFLGNKDKIEVSARF
ncbi:unnamed protein product, partial [marine sediment metagenome]